MLVFKTFKGISRSQRLKWRNSQAFLSSQKSLKNVVKTNERKYFKQITTLELEPWRGCNLFNLFAGTINKRLLNYPTVISNEGIDTILKQSQEVETFFSLNEGSKLTDDVIEKLKKLELFGLSVSQDFGGASYNETETKFLLECAGHNPTIARFVGYKEDFGSRLINHFGTEEQKKKYLPDLAEGKRFMTLAFLENEPIIDLWKLEGFVITDNENNHYNLTANKKWVHYADKADLFLVLAKSSEIKNDSTIELKLNMFIVEKNMPGVTVYEIKSPCATKAHLFEVGFKDVHLPLSNVLGGEDISGHEILKFALSHSNLTDAVLSLSLMKYMLHDALQFVEEKGLTDKRVRGHLHVNESIAVLMSYIYALESVTYLLIGSFDMYEKPDLFNDSIMAKVIAVDSLRAAIQLYTDIVRQESFKKGGIVEKAVEVLHYYSVFDESIEYLKLMCASEGLTAVANKLNHKVKILKNPFDNPYKACEFFIWKNKDLKKLKSQLNLKMELHSVLSGSADIVEENLIKLPQIIESLFVREGGLAIYCEHAVTKLTEAASYIFAIIACLSRASSSTCYDINNFQSECAVAGIFTKISDIKIKQIYEDELMHSELLENYRYIGKTAFNYKEYPMEHPLVRVI